jgi:hypothetical protein
MGLEAGPGDGQMTTPLATENLRAVLTGDVVASTRLPLEQRSHFPALFEGLPRSLGTAFGDDLLPFGVDTVRGDGFQTLVSNPAMALRVALFIRASVRALAEVGYAHLRIAIGIGTVDFMGNRVSEGLGAAFQLSGKRLDRMKSDSRFGIDCRLDGFDTGTWDVVLGLMDVLVDTWTPKQAAAVCGALKGWTQQSIADRWDVPIKQQTVARHLKRAGWGALVTALEHFEDSF